MKSIFKRLLFLGLGLSLVAIAGARELEEQQIEGSLGDGPDPEPEGRQPIPFPVAASDPAGDSMHARSHPVFIPATTVTFSGRLVRRGSLIALRETAGRLYTLDGVYRVLPFEDKDVRVTGKLDTTRRLLHVDAIESFVA